jgi:hypothetical protein
MEWMGARECVPVVGVVCKMHESRPPTRRGVWSSP